MSIQNKKPLLILKCPDLQIDEKWNTIQNVTIYSPLTDIFIPTGHKPFAIVGDMLTDLDRHLTLIFVVIFTFFLFN